MSITLAPSHWGIITCDNKTNPDIYPRERNASLATYFTEEKANSKTFVGIGADYWGIFGFSGIFFDEKRTDFIKTYLQSSKDTLKGKIFYRGINNSDSPLNTIGSWNCENQRGGFTLTPNEKLKKLDLRDNKGTQETIFNFLARAELKILNGEVSSYIRENPYTIGIDLDSIK